MVDEEGRIYNDSEIIVEGFTKHIEALTDQVRCGSKVNDFNIGTMPLSKRPLRIIVFQIANKNYLTYKDAVGLIEYHLEHGLYECDGIEDLLKKWCMPQRMVDIDDKFDNEDLEVLDSSSLNKEAIQAVLRKAKKKEEKYSTRFFGDNINFYGENNGFMYESENRMFKDVEINEFDKSNEKYAKSNHDYFYRPKNGEYEKNLNMKIDELGQYQPFSNDWTNEMVDSIIGNMFEKEEVTAPVMDEIDEYNNGVRDHEMLEMQAQFAKTEKAGITSRPFVCQYRNCNRAFKRFEHLKRHYRIHTGERPFKCKYPGCHKAFARSDNLNQHLRVHNNGTQNYGGTRNLRYFDDSD